MADLPRRLAGERLVLRGWKLSDVDDVLAYAADFEWGRYIPTPLPYTRGDAEVFVAQQRLVDWSNVGSWAILPDGEPAIGSIEIRREVPHRATLGYALARAHWGHGYATLSGRIVLHAAFTHWPDLAKVIAYCDARNTASQRVLLRLGFQEEGRLRRHFRHREELIDARLYGLLRPGSVA